MKILSVLFLINLLCFAIMIGIDAHHIHEPRKYVDAYCSAWTTENDDGVETHLLGMINAAGIQLGGYHIQTTGIASKPKSRRFRGSANATTQKHVDMFIHVTVSASVGGLFYDGQGDMDSDWAEAGAN